MAFGTVPRFLSLYGLGAIASGGTFEGHHLGILQPFGRSVGGEPRNGVSIPIGSMGLVYIPT